MSIPMPTPTPTGATQISGGVKVVRYSHAEVQHLPLEQKVDVAWDGYARTYVNVNVVDGSTVMDLINATVVRVDWEEGGNCRAWLCARIPERTTWMKVHTMMRDEGFHMAQELDTAQMDLFAATTARVTHNLGQKLTNWMKKMSKAEKAKLKKEKAKAFGGGSGAAKKNKNAGRWN